MTFHRVVPTRQSRTLKKLVTAGVPRDVRERMRRVVLLVPQGWGDPGELEAALEWCPQRRIGPVLGRLLQCLAEEVPNVEELEVQYFKSDDCLLEHGAVKGLVDYEPGRDGLWDVRVVEMLDALEGEGRCLLPRLKRLRLVVRGEICSYMAYGGVGLCCAVARYVPVSEGSTATLVGKERWWSEDVPPHGPRVPTW
jgi:hypothetical protein